jgi:predicted GH43/DUF377 family glycosyl hydrolase
MTLSSVIIEPHKVVEVEEGNAEPANIFKTSVALRTGWQLKHKLGGTPPIRVGGEYFSFFHSWERKTRLRDIPRLKHAKRFYYTGAYAFEAKPPFRVTRITPGPLMEPESISTVIRFASGAMLKKRTWSLSFGVADNQCWLTQLEHKQLLVNMEKVINDNLSCS